MAKRDIVWTRTADLQLIGILEYWVNRNKSKIFAEKLLKLVVERTLQISETPLAYKLTDYKDIRVASLRNFSLYYKVTNHQIIIYAFWDNRQDPEDLLKILQSEG